MVGLSMKICLDSKLEASLLIELLTMNLLEECKISMAWIRMTKTSERKFNSHANKVWTTENKKLIDFS